MRYNCTQDRTQRSQKLPRAGTADDYKVDCSCRWLLSALRYTEVTCHVSRGPAGRRCAETRHYQGTSRPHAPHTPCTALLLLHQHQDQESSVEHFLASKQKPTLHQATTCIPSMSTSLHTKPVQSEHVSPVPDKYDNWILHKSDGGSKYIRWPEVVLAE